MSFRFRAAASHWSPFSSASRIRSGGARSLILNYFPSDLRALSLSDTDKPSASTNSLLRSPSLILQSGLLQPTPCELKQAPVLHSGIVHLNGPS